MVEIYSKSEIDKIRVSADILKEIFFKLKDKIVVGITTNDIDALVSEYVLSKGGICSTKGYQGFPSSCCVSINEEVIHGIPTDKRVIQDGDIVSVDIVISKDSFHADACRTFTVGKVSEQGLDLVKATEEAFFAGVAHARVGSRLYDISSAIQEHVESKGYGVVREFCGHGVGRKLHEEPSVPNYGKAGRGLRLKKGMVLAIEPMVTAGDYKIKILSDKWTVITVDNSLSAHYENTVLITDKEPEILTLAQ